MSRIWCKQRSGARQPLRSRGLSTQQDGKGCGVACSKAAACPPDRCRVSRPIRSIGGLMSIRSIVMVALGLTFIAASSSLAQSSPKYQWKLESTDKGCQTYTSTVQTKEYIAAKAVCVVPARIDVVGTVL